ncbi:TM2 domain-containing protein [Staphylococcus equorum]|uniref:TM2 domain-containing protein n=1 Tax=Staphylococcus equorum TaxID=246432 RepID=A0A9X4R2X4_9STAP|nr:TM2 domain-containing protein [Staphylococcus equorum]MDG0860369.1 TM2 domain-containing protein [Staphylococcus equorum]
MVTNMATKQNLSQQELLVLHNEMERSKKKKGTAFALWFFLGGIGTHRYYMGDIGYALGMTFTLGGLGLWTLIDAFFIAGRIDELNSNTERDLIINLGLNK